MTKLTPLTGGASQIIPHARESQSTDRWAAEPGRPRVQDILHASSPDVPVTRDMPAEALANFTSTVESLGRAVNFDELERALRSAAAEYRNARAHVSHYNETLSEKRVEGNDHLMRLLSSGETHLKKLSMNQLASLQEILETMPFAARGDVTTELDEMYASYAAGDASFQLDPASMTLEELNRLHSDTLRLGHDLPPTLLNEIDGRVREGG